MLFYDWKAQREGLSAPHDMSRVLSVFVAVVLPSFFFLVAFAAAIFVPTLALLLVWGKKSV